MVTFHTNFGVIKLDLFADKAPKTVENFKSYVAEGFYEVLSSTVLSTVL